MVILAAHGTGGVGTVGDGGRDNECPTRARTTEVDTLEGVSRPLSARTGTPARTFLSLVIVVVLAGVAAPVSGQQTEPQVKQHVVQRGETLWGLSGFYFMNPYLWPQIFEANRDVIEDPHWIYPDEVLRIPGIESGLPVVVRQQEPVTAAGPDAQPHLPSQPVRPAGRTRFWEEPPPVDARRESDMAMTKLELYAVTPAEFWSAAWLEDSAAVGIRGRLISLADPVSQRDRLPQYLHPFDEVLFGWLRGGELVLGDSMMVVTVREQVGSLGHVIQPVALVRIDSVGENVAAALVLRQYGKARVGDMLIAAAELPRFQRGAPATVKNGAEGRLIAWLEREQLYGPLADGFIDIGAEQGVRIGDEFAAYVPVRTDAGGSMDLPAEQVARLRVIKVMPNSATVRVTDASSTALQAGVRVQLVRKMPAN
jgi:hypothetical protein